METVREIFDFYIPKLILKMADPMPAIRFCEAYNPVHTTIKNLTKNLSGNQMQALINIVLHAKYKENPKPIVQEMNDKINELKKQGKLW